MNEQEDRIHAFLKWDDNLKQAAIGSSTEEQEKASKIFEEKSARDEYKIYRNLSALFALRESPLDKQQGLAAYGRFVQLRRRRTLRRLAQQTLRYAAAILPAVGLTWAILHYTGSATAPGAIRSVSAPWGHQAEVRLEDGTQVWFNAGSTLTCSEHFSQRREVQLSGEAFFNVTHDKRHPFVVSAGDLEIRVLGTEFNVSAYTQTTATVSLVEGSVEVSAATSTDESVIMATNDRLCYTEGNFSLTHSFDPDELLWRKGIHAFKNASLQEITDRLGFYYHTRIIIRNSAAAAVRYSGKFRQEEGVYEILRLLRQVQNFSLSRDNSSGTIYID